MSKISKTFSTQKTVEDIVEPFEIWYIVIYKKSDMTKLIENYIDNEKESMVKQMNIKLTKKIFLHDLKKNQKKTFRVPKRNAMYVTFVDKYDHQLLICLSNKYNDKFGNNMLIEVSEMVVNIEKNLNENMVLSDMEKSGFKSKLNEIAVKYKADDGLYVAGFDSNDKPDHLDTETEMSVMDLKMNVDFRSDSKMDTKTDLFQSDFERQDSSQNKMFDSQVSIDQRKAFETQISIELEKGGKTNKNEIESTDKKSNMNA